MTKIQKLKNCPDLQKILSVPSRREQRNKRLKGLVAKIPKSYKSKEADWGQPVGKEVW
jgi:antitoxin component of MazEF toxin-antitoxin module